MASSKVMASTSTTNPDRPRHHLPHSSPSTSSFLTTTTTTSSPSFTTTSQPPHPLYHSTSSFGSVNMEEILKNMYTEPDSLDAPPSGSVSIDGPPTGVVVLGPRMTLEDFLTKAGAVSEDDVRVPPPPPPVAAGGYGGADAHGVMGVQFPAAPGPVVHVQNGDGVAQLRYGNGMVAAAAAAALIGGGGGGRGVGGRGKRRGAPVEELVLDKATQQKQKRMIKNRESAARSRERKQAYTVELETLVTQLEAENARLLQQEAEQNKERLKQEEVIHHNQQLLNALELMENLIPVVEKRRPPRSLRRLNSMSW